MSGDIFYSEVNPAVQKELNARGLSGKSRHTKDLNFMVGKIANIQVEAYGKPKGTDNYVLIVESTLNGSRVRSSEYLPGGKDGFLADRPWERKESGVTESGVNTSRRIPPFVTSVDINVTDHSIGLLNSCTFNITVPNPERDLEYIESIYCRPGRPVNVTVEYPESAVLNGNNIIPSSSMESLTALRQQNKEVKQEPQTLNKVRFQGLILNFSIDYQTDMTAVVNVILKGTTNVFTDVTAIMDSSKASEEKVEPILSGSRSLFDGIRTEFESKIIQADQTAAHKISNEYPIGQGYVVKLEENGKLHYGLTGRINSKSSPIEQFVSLGWLISFINRKILTKINTVLLITPEIIFDITAKVGGVSELTNIASSHPAEIHLPGGSPLTQTDREQLIQDNTGNTRELRNELQTTNTYYTLQMLPVESGGPDVEPAAATIKRSDGQAVEDGGLLNIMINLNTIESVYETIQNKTTGTVKIKEFLSVIFEKIKAATGLYVDLKLITHPIDETKLLIYNVSQKPSLLDNTVTPYSVPMFANHPYGTVITDFKFSGKLPTDAANLAFAINDFDSDTSTSDIAPFLNFMYSNNNITRTRDTNVITDSVDPLISLDEMEEKYSAKRTQAKREWDQARINYGKKPSTEGSTEMHHALIKWVSMLQSDFKTQVAVKNPIIPFEVEFTINGINGFKWGDVLTFDGLPSRYKRNTVFSIIAISHTVTDSGEWKTNIRCLTRAKID